MLEKIKKDKKFLEFIRLLNELQSEYGLSASSIIALSKKIPVSIFSTELSPLEGVVKYLYENIGVSFVSIARMLYRTKQGIYQAYKSSKQKKIVVEKSRYDFPLSVLMQNRYSVLESIVKYYREELGLKFSQIARIISRDQRTVWVVYNRTKKK